MSAVDLHIHRTPMKELRRDSLGERWCFRERRRVEFFHVVTGTVEPSYYDPSARVECGSCRSVDADLFPGWTREY